MTITATNYAIKKGLPKKTQSICPECGKIIEANIFARDGKVYMEKTCPEHGVFSDVYWSDVDLYLKAEKYAYDGVGVHNAMDRTIGDDPDDTVHIVIDGQRIDMLSCSAIANLDLTNRCNMNCPICFANANDAGYVYEPSYDEVHQMLVALRSEKPIKCTAVQFAGGEPTVYPRFVDVVRDAHELGFAQVQVATNGIKFARDYEFLKASKEAGLNTIYLQFDGLTDEVYLRSRGRKMMQIKLDVIANCRKLKDQARRHRQLQEAEGGRAQVPVDRPGPRGRHGHERRHHRRHHQVRLRELRRDQGSQLPAHRLHRQGHKRGGRLRQVHTARPGQVRGGADRIRHQGRLVPGPRRGPHLQVRVHHPRTEQGHLHDPPPLRYRNLPVPGRQG